ncbi:two-component regulator propeller domain-containing protein [Sphingomonas sp. RB3P16]|uniref:sensor histidine kinase n=1 Tax=Parasphingomonas frigoris TaxID=3096163 RepID=UPI002FC60903
MTTFIAVFGMASVMPSRSLGGDLLVSQYKHTRWTVDDGAPSPINALAQGRDGYLYIGAGEGLYRFDGNSFEMIPPDKEHRDRGSVMALLAAKDGSIWVGYGAGGVARYAAGALRDTNVPHPIDVMRLAQTSDGAIWALLGRTERPLVRFFRGRWAEIGRDWGLPDKQGADLMTARDGSLWISSPKAIYFLRTGTTRFVEASFHPVGYGALAQDRDGRIWVSDQTTARALSSPISTRHFYPVPYGPRRRHALFDREGALWGNTSVGGIYKVSSPNVVGESSSQAAASRLDRFREKDSLTSDQANAILEDREGSLWVGTQVGLDRFRSVPIVSEALLTLVPQWGDVLLGAANGDVYLGQHDGVYRARPGEKPEPVLLGAGEAEAMCQGEDGMLWFVMQQRIVRFGTRPLENIRKPASRQALIDCAVDHRGHLYVTSAEGAFERTRGGWRLFAADRGDLTDGAMPIISRTDGKLLTYVSNRSLRLYDPPNMTDIVLHRPAALRNLKTLYQRPDAILLGGAFGLAKWHGKRFDFLTSRRVPALRNVFGIAPTPDGYTWLMARRHIVRIATADLDHAFADPNWIPPVLALDYFDGLPGIGVRDGKRDAVRGGDGRIWFSTTAGIVWIDPARLPHNPRPPPVAISAVHVDGRTYHDPQSVEIRPGIKRLTLDFSALSLSIPQRVRVRYHLEGADAGWVEAGKLRNATYTNLRPGQYRFHVIAANEDGVWNQRGATLKLVVLPTFFESQIFTALCVAAGLCLLWLAYVIRTRQLTARVRDRLAVQLNERERIARELHDTLLQGFQGLVLRFQAVANRMSSDSALRASIDDALQHAETIITEGRNRVIDLRFADNDADLASEIVEATSQPAGGPAPPISVMIKGRVRPLVSIVREELLRISQEAVRNAVQHSSASRIEVAVQYGRQVQLSVKDNGRGLPAEVATAGSRPGHFGLVGMRERAERTGGKFTIVSLPRQGTEVYVTVPGRLAYHARRTRE